MNNVDPVIDAATAAVQEAERRAKGEPPDRRFDTPLAMLADLADTLKADPPNARHPYGRCSELPGCQAPDHLTTCPESGRR